MKRVLVTGASGFIGRHVLPELAARGFEIHAVARTPLKKSLAGETWHALDLHQKKSIARLLKQLRPTHLLHLAWHVPPGHYQTSAENRRWLATSLHLFRQFYALGGQRIVAVGTCMEYDWSAPPPFHENKTPLRPATPYGRAKATVSRRLLQLARGKNRSAAWARLFFLYGPWEAPGRLVSSLATHFRAGEPAPCSSGRQKRDYMHVADAARALVVILDGSLRGSVNVATGQAVSVRRVVETFAGAAKRMKLVRLGALPDRLGEPPLIQADTRRLTARGFKRRYSLKGGLEHTWQWWARHE